ncbi:hypothetical protein TWF718_000972 [Orbilia javanica]
MLTHLSAKFHMGNPEDQGTHEPRVALILNRFTRTLTVLYASHASSSIFGITPSQLTGKSFFECIHEDCLQEAVDALERAKENDSIAYLRFRWRDPIQNAEVEEARTQEPAPVERPLRRSRRISSKSKRKLEGDDQDEASGSSSRPSKRRAIGPRGEEALAHQGESSRSRPLARDASPPVAESPAVPVAGSGTGLGTVAPPREVEAVVSCTSDGLVVILRQARPLIPKPLHNVPNGIFASPWAPISLVPRIEHLPDKNREANFMEAIQQVAVFAWSLRQLGGEITPSPGSEKANTDAGKGKGKGKGKDRGKGEGGEGGEDGEGEERDGGDGDNQKDSDKKGNKADEDGLTNGSADQGSETSSESKAQQKAAAVGTEAVNEAVKQEQEQEPRGRSRHNTRKPPR